MARPLFVCVCVFALPVVPLAFLSVQSLPRIQHWPGGAETERFPGDASRILAQMDGMCGLGPTALLGLAHAVCVSWDMIHHVCMP